MHHHGMSAEAWLLVCIRLIILHTSQAYLIQVVCYLHEFDKPKPVMCGCARSLQVFDFVTKGVLTEAVRQTQYWRLRDDRGRPAGFIGWWVGSPEGSDIRQRGGGG